MVQVGLDIGSPAYGQLQNLHSVDMENVRVGGDDDESQMTQTDYQAIQASRLRAAHAMYVSLTDGFQTVKGLEMGSIPQIP